MRWRFELSHVDAGTETMSEPEGFVSGVIGFIRHPELKSLVKEFRSGLRAYGSNGAEDGLRDWIKNVESTYGPDTIVVLKIYRAADNYAFSVWYTGEIGIQTIVEGLELDHYLEFTPVQTSLWRAAMARFETPVNIQSATNLDGESITIYDPEVVNLKSQTLRTKTDVEQKLAYDYGVDYPIAPTTPSSTLIEELPRMRSFQINLLDFILDEVTENHNIPNGSSETELNDDGVRVSGPEISPLITAEYQGVYLVEIRLPFTEKDYFFEIATPPIIQRYNPTNGTADVSGGEESPELKVFLQKNDEAPIELTRTDFGSGTSQWSEYEISTTFNLNAGDQIKLFGLPITGSGSPGYYYFYNTSGNQFQTKSLVLLGLDNSGILWDHITPLAFAGTPNPAYLRITADTIYPETQAPGFLIHDVGAAILDRITLFGKFFAPVIGSEFTRARVYGENGAWWNNANLKGMHIRGYLLSEKIFSMSMKDYWDGIKPLINPGMGYETIEGEEVITLRPIEEYYNPEMSVLLSGVQRIKRKYGPEYYNSVEVGFANGKTEEVSGIDDAQKQTRASVFKNMGSSLKILCQWIAQGLTFEWTRRKTIKKSADFKFDDNNFVLEVNRVSGEYEPRIDDDFTATTGMINADTRYNKHHSPVHIFLRHTNLLFAGLQNYVGSVYRFVSGEGNYDISTTMVNGSAPDDYDGAPLAENANIPVGTTILYIPKIFEFEHYLTIEEFDIIDANRNKAIGISQTYEDGSHQPFFIDELQMEIMTGQIKGTGKFKNEFNIQTVQQGGQIFQGGRIFDASFSSEFE